MTKYYNMAGDLLITAAVCMEQGLNKKALECAELALQTPDMKDIVIGLKQLNTEASDEMEEDEDIELEEAPEDDEMELEVEESCGDEDDDEEIEIDDEEEEDEDLDDDEEIEDACGRECASADEEDECEDGECDDEDIEIEEDEEDEEIDEAKLDEVLCSLRKQYKITSSIKPSLSSKLSALAKKIK